LKKATLLRDQFSMAIFCCYFCVTNKLLEREIGVSRYKYEI
jgi:hypothetical protein